MIYSYISPRKKSALTPDVKLVLSFFVMAIFVLLLTYFFLLYKDYAFERDTKNIETTLVSTQKNIDTMKSEITTIQKQVALAQTLQTQNSVLKDSIENLFDLVPDRITLSKAELLKNGLILYGITPNKDVYNFMLHAPLRSIFQRTYSSFFPLENGWLRFVSTNYMESGLTGDVEELENED